MNYARRLVRELSARRKPKAQHQKMLRRALFSESLEPRSMMAADLGNSDYWNADKPWDVNGDGKVSTIDAVLVINRLRGDVQKLAPVGTMEGETTVGNRYVDVNNDWQLSTIDALLVINRLNSPPEAEQLADDTVNYEVRLLQPGTNNLLSANTIGFNGEFDLQLRVQDLHKDLGAKGVVQAFADILITNKDLVQVQVAEVQTIAISDFTGGSFTLTFNGATTDPITVVNTGNSPVDNLAIMADIRNKLGALSTIGGVQNIAVTQVESVDPLPNGQWQVRFVGSFYNQDVNPLTGSFTPPGGTPEDVSVTSFDPTTAEAFKESFRSLNLSGVGVDKNVFFYQRNFDASTDVDGRFNDIGGALVNLFVSPGTAPREVARVRLKANGTTAGQVVFQPSILDIVDTSHDTLVFRDAGGEVAENSVVVAVDTPARSVGSLVSATTTAATGRINAGATTTSFSVTAFGALGAELSSADDTYNGLNFRISSGTLSGQVKVVQDYDGATKTFTFASAFTAVPAANVSFFVDGSVTVPLLAGSATPPRKGEFFKITSGTLNGRTAEVTQFDSSTGRIGYEVPFSATSPVSVPAVGDTLQIHENVRGTATNPDSVTLTIVSGPIQVADDLATVAEDSVANAIDVLGNDNTTPSGGTKTVVSVSGTSANGGTVTVGAGNSNVLYTPAANFAGTDTFTYVARNLTAGATSQTETGIVTVTVNGVNDAPTLAVISNVTVADNAGQQTVNLSGIDEGGGADENTQNLVITATSSNTALVPNPPAIAYTQDSTGAVLNFTPNANALGAAASGTAVITVTVTDDGSNTTPNVNVTTRTFTVTVNATNDAPVNQKGGAALVAGTEVAATLGEAFQFQGADLLSVVDADSENVSTTVTIAGGAGGTLSATGGTGSGSTSITFTGTKAAVNAGLATLVYNQPAGNTSFATATLTVATTDQGNPTPNVTDTDAILININPPQGPFARDEQLSRAEDAGPYDLDVLANDFANPGAETTLETVTLISPTTGGITAVLVDAGVVGDKTDDIVRVTVPQHFNGPVIVEYTISETPVTGQTLANDTARVTLTVTGVNDAPVANDDLLYEVAIGSTLTVNAANGVLANDTDVDANDTKTVSASTASSIPGLTLNADGSFTFAPTGTAGGDVSFTYTVRDSGGLTDEGLVKIHIAPRPTADNDSYTATEGVPLVVNAANGVLNGDVDPEIPPATLTATPVGNIVTSPAGSGSVTLNADGSFTYNPSDNFFGTASFSYRASANGRESLPAIVTFTVVEDNDAPTAVDDLGPDNDADGTPDGVTIIKLFGPAQEDQVIDVLANDTDPDNLDGFPGNDDTLEIQSVDATGANGTVTIGTNGTRDVLLYTPNEGFVGTASFTYTITDGEDTDTAVVKVNVVEFQPKTISGFIFTDKLMGGVLNHTVDEGERVFAGVEVRLTGVDFVTKQPLSQIDPRTGETVEYLIAYTDLNGQYTFENVAPPDDGTSYTLSARTPTFFRDGLEFNMVDGDAASLVTNISDDAFTLQWAVNDTSGDLIGLNFTEGNLNTSLLGVVPKAEEVRTSNPNAPDASLGFYLLVEADGSVIVSRSLMEGHPLNGWDGLDASMIEIVDMTGIAGSHHTIYPTLTLLIHGQEVTMFQQPHLQQPAGDPLGARFRLYGDPNGAHIIRVAGSADDFGITLADDQMAQGGGEGEAASYPNYVQGADEVFTGQSWA